jgi:SAM-dependent methyltransferase
VNQGFLIRRALWKEIRKYAKSAEGKILDFGCGSKPYETAFSACDSYTGLDIAQSGHDHTNSRIDVLYDGKTLPFSDHTFDKILCFEVFEHLQDPGASLEELARVLRFGGELFITIPFIYGEHEAPFDFQRWTSFGIVNLLRMHNFRVVKMEKLNPNFGVLTQLCFDEIFLRGNSQRSTIASIVKIPFITFANIFIMMSSMIHIRNQNIYSNLVCIAVLESSHSSSESSSIRLDII